MMCARCDHVVSVSTGLAWAIPVDIQKLGPRLEAYLELKPALQQLRLCHRFGKGPDAHITKLPQELFEIVVEDVLNTARDDAPYLKWAKPFACFEEMCNPIDHFEESDLNDTREWLSQDLEEDSNLDELQCDLERAVGEWDYYDQCRERQQQWENMVEQKPRGPYVCQHLKSAAHAFDKYDQVSHKCKERNLQVPLPVEVVHLPHLIFRLSYY